MREKVYSLLICAVFALLIISCSTADDVTIYSPTVIAEPAVENKVKEPVVQAIAETEKVKEAEVAKVPEAEETSEPIVRNYVFMGYYLKVTIGNGVAYVEYPSIITKSDIDNAVAAAESVYGAYLKDITYSVKDGIITINFPKTYGMEELLLAEKVIQKELPAYVESLFAETPVTAEIPTPEAAKVITKTVVSGQDLIKTYKYMGYQVKATIGNGVAYVEYPSIITKSDIDNAVAAAVSVYGAYLKDISYSVKDGIITVNFPKTYGEKELLFAEKIISDELPAYVASLFGEIPVAVVEPAIETAKEELKEELKEEDKAVAEKSAEPVTKTEPAKAATPVKTAEVPVVQEEAKKGLSRTVIIIIAFVAVVLAFCFLLHKKKNKK